MDNSDQRKDQRKDVSALESTKPNFLINHEQEHSFRKVRDAAVVQTANDQSSVPEMRRSRRRAKKERKRYSEKTYHPHHPHHPAPTLQNFHYQLPPGCFQPPPPHERFERNQRNQNSRQTDIRQNTARYDYNYDVRKKNDNYDYNMTRRQNFTQASRNSWRDDYNYRSRSQSHDRRQSKSPQRRFNTSHIRVDTYFNSLRRYDVSPPPITSEPTSSNVKQRQIITNFASPSYLNIANEDSVNLENPQPKLLVLDLNGTLLYREKVKNGKNIMLRPFVKKFIQYIFESNSFVVMVWSSSQPFNVDRMVKAAFGQYEKKLLAKWTRIHFNLSNHDYFRKVETIKDLEKVWKEFNNIKSTTLPQIIWDQKNTILIDDSYEKTKLQPYNAIHLPDFDNERYKNRNDNELNNVIEYLKIVHKQSNVSSYIKDNPYISSESQLKSK